MLGVSVEQPVDGVVFGVSEVDEIPLLSTPRPFLVEMLAGMMMMMLLSLTRDTKPAAAILSSLT